MRTYFRNILLALLIAFVVQTVSDRLGSPFIVDFLSENLITLLLALLAINTTTISVIMTKLREIADATGISFKGAIGSMKESIVEQVILLAVAVVVLVLKDSSVVASAAPWADFVFNVLLITTILLAVQVLYDTANGVFVIAQTEDRIESENTSSSENTDPPD